MPPAKKAKPAPTMDEPNRLDDLKASSLLLDECYGKLIEVIDAHPGWGFHGLRDRLDGQRRQLANEEFLVVVFGEFKHGKSTFCNVVIESGEEVCPVRATPETARITRIHKRPADRDADYFRVTHRADYQGAVETGDIPLTTSRLHEYVGQKGTLNQSVEKIDVYVAGKGTPLDSGVVYVDTPGLKSIFADHDVIATEYLQHASAVVFLFSGVQPFTQQEQEFLRIHPELISDSRTLFVLNRIDHINGGDEASITEAVEFVRKELENLGVRLSGDPSALPQLFPISAQQAFEARKLERSGKRAEAKSLLEKSRFAPVRKALFSAIADKKGRILVEAALDQQRVALGELGRSRDAMAGVLGQARKTEADIERETRDWIEKRKSHDARLDELKREIRGRSDDLRVDHGGRVDRFVERLVKQSRGWINSIGDPKQARGWLVERLSSEASLWMGEHSGFLGDGMEKIRAHAERTLRDIVSSLMADVPDARGDLGGIPVGDIESGIHVVIPAGGGLMAGAGIGFLVAGPLGAAIGGAIGAAAGALGRIFFGVDWRDDAKEKVESAIRRELLPRLMTGGYAYIDGYSQSLDQTVTTRVESVIEQITATLEVQKALSKDAVATRRKLEKELEALNNGMAEVESRHAEVRALMGLVIALAAAGTA